LTGQKESVNKTQVQDSQEKGKNRPEKRFFPLIALLGIGIGVVVGIIVTLISSDGSFVTQGTFIGLGIGTVVGAGVDSFRRNQKEKADHSGKSR